MRITVGFGLTVQLGENSREFAKLSVEMQDIDPDGNVKEQVEKGCGAAVKVWEAQGKILYTKLVEVTDTERPLLAGEIEVAVKSAKGGRK